MGTQYDQHVSFWGVCVGGGVAYYIQPDPDCLFTVYKWLFEFRHVILICPQPFPLWYFDVAVENHNLR